MNEIREWSFEGIGIRTVEIDGEPWWVLKDVCIPLELSSPHKVAARLDDDEKGRSLIPTLGGSQQLTVINESGLYAVILRSDKPQAKAFRKWITSEVLPQIRKTGQYKRQEPEEKAHSYMIDDKVLRAQRWVEETQEWLLTVRTLETQIKQQEHKVALANAIVEGPDCIHVGDLAKILRQNGIETGKTRLFKWMREHEWLCSGKTERNFPTQRAIERGYMVLKEHTLHLNGEEVKRFTPMVTGAGQEFFVNWFLANGNPGRRPCELAAERLCRK